MLSRCFRAILFLLFLGLLYSFLIGWTNIWVKDGYTGVLLIPYSSDNSLSEKSGKTYESIQYHSTIVKKNKYHWQWKRIIPFHTQLIQVPLFIQSATIPIQYYLPSAKQYSTLLEESEDIFLSSGIANIEYRIKSELIIEYMHTHRLIASQDIMRSIERDISTKIINTSIAGIESENIKTISNTIENLLDTLPISINTIDLSFQRTPDYKTYAIAKTLYQNILTQTQGNNQNKQRNYSKEYVSLLRNISTIVQQSPANLEVIKFFSIEDFIFLMDKQDKQQQKK